jgi:hypothetical protein|tara:strand:- start:375 stop:617 length:243 start_codon:yes stop_codon:yes gene_type:complete
MSYKITRLGDEKEFQTEGYKFIEFDDEGEAKGYVDSPKIGASLIIPPYNMFYTWMTSAITEVIDEHSFLTKNSNYKIEEL